MIKMAYTCIVCPRSCKMDLMVKGANEFEVNGNLCKRGREYAINEYLCPKRMLTTTVKIINGIYSNIPVVSGQEIDRAKFFECLDYLYSMEVEAPIVEGDVLVKNILGTDVDILAARDMDCKN
jgi:CxxC motif-containing protein